jgi:hypothetical protein
VAVLVLAGHQTPLLTPAASDEGASPAFTASASRTQVRRRLPAGGNAIRTIGPSATVTSSWRALPSVAISSVPYAFLAASYALEGQTEPAAAALLEARSLAGDNRYSSIARARASGHWGVSAVQALFEATYFAGLRKAGMPEE